MKPRIFGALCAVLFTLTTLAANAAFFGRLPATPGGLDYQAFYDDQLDITWTADANINGFDIWDNHIAWAERLTLGGVTGWRLPNMDLNRDGAITSCASPFVTRAECIDNEYGYLFYYGAGTTYESGVTPNSPGPFSNVVRSSYWSGTEYTSIPSEAWLWIFEDGLDPGMGHQGIESKDDAGYAWAVHSGDVGAIPIPATIWLFGTGLLGLLGLARRRANNKHPVV